MRSSIIAFFLSAAAMAGAQAAATPAPAAVTPAAVVQPTAPHQPAVMQPAPVPAKASARPSPELITTAVAVTHDGPPGAHMSSGRSRAPSTEDRPRRTGSAMLLAALALMSGIALRRYSARQQ